MSGDLFAALQTPAPTFPAKQAAALLEEHYGIAGELEPLQSERDQNFLVSGADRARYVLKFASESEAEAITDFQNQGLAHIARVAPNFPVPRVVSTRDNAKMFEATSETGATHRVRLLSWLDGVPLQIAQGVTSIAAQTGTCLATLGVVLRDFEHPASDYPLLWDIRNAARLADLLPFVDDADLRALCETRLERFRAVTSPSLDVLRKQVIYNDMNPSNVLVDRDDVSRLCGVIDFGDMIHSQLVNDVAVAAAYLCKVDDDPFADVLDFLAAYTAVLPLTEEEISVLPDLVLTRTLTTVMISHWRASLYPDNRAYILRNETRARQMILRVAELSVSDTIGRFLEVCQPIGTPEAGR
jgi:Ser/Thr protein kinase RdoA (MazF antagonist)